MHTQASPTLRVREAASFLDTSDTFCPDNGGDSGLAYCLPFRQATPGTIRRRR